MADIPGRPATSVSGGSAADDIPVAIRSMEAIAQSVADMVRDIGQNMNVQDRYAMAGAGSAKGAAAAQAGQIYNRSLPQVRESVLRQIAATGGMNVEHMTAGMTKLPPAAALASLSNLRTFTAQKAGEFFSGQSLYGGDGADGAPAGSTVSTPGGGTATVDPVSPAGAGGAGMWGAQYQQMAAGVQGSTTAAAASTAAAAGASSASGTAATAAAAGGAAALTGLPGKIWGPGGPTTAKGKAMQSAMQNIGARVALSGGSGGGIIGALSKLPVIGLGMDLIGDVTGSYLKQREAGRVYQETEGGSNLSAQAERMHAAIYEASMYGRMPSGSAAQAFGDVTGMGFSRATAGGQQGQNRQSALDFIYHNYTATGMDIDQSAKILQTASQNSAISLGQVSDALSKLSDTAGKAGTNAITARNNFDTLMQAAIGGGAGSGAPGIAGAVAGMQASYGKAFAGTSFAGQLGANEQYMLSGQYGISPSDAQYLERNNPGAYARMLTGSALQMIQQYLTPGEMSDLQSMIAAAGGGSASNPAIQQQVADQFLNKWQPQDNRLDENVMASYFSQVTNIPLTPNTVMPWIVGQVSGSSTAAAHFAASSGAAAVSAGSTRGAARGQYGLAQGTSGSSGASTGRLGGLLGGTGSKSWQQVLIDHSGTAARAYLTEERKSGKRSPVLEALLQNLPQGQGVRVQVQTKNGPRVMSFADAMKFYPDEMEAGNVQFYNAKGVAIGDTSSVTHGLTDPAASTAEEEKQAAGSMHGLSMAKWSKGHPQKPSGAGGNVTVSLTQEAAQLLKLLPSNNDAAAASSTVPANTSATQASR